MLKIVRFDHVYFLSPKIICMSNKSKVFLMIEWVHAKCMGFGILYKFEVTSTQFS